MPHSLREQSKRILVYLAENQYLQIEAKKNKVLIHGKS